jgi:uncharacterized protein YkwD
MRKIFVFSLLIIFVLGTILFLNQKLIPQFSKKGQEIKIEFERLTPKTEIQKEFKVFTPPPLKVESEKEGFLTQKGILVWTNIQREKFNLEPLKESQLLNQSAKLKLEDMFKNQYFAHTSPEGIELKDLMEKVNYEFIVIGENLAMGKFESDKELVSAWMESVGHRENILNEKYQEIGVAVKKGIFKGKEVWIAVQHFGKPLSACPQPKESLKAEIEENEEKLKELENTLNSLKREIESERSKWKVKEKIEKYNNLVDQYNSLLKETQNLISEYNQQVELFNQCVIQ